MFSILRYVYLIKRLHEPEPMTQHYFVLAVTWSLVEINASIILVNMPTLMPIVVSILDAWVWLCKMKRKIDAGATHGPAVTDGILLRPMRPRSQISSSEADLEHTADLGEAEAERFDPQAEQPTDLLAEAQRPASGFETTSSGSLRQERPSMQYRVTN